VWLYALSALLFAAYVAAAGGIAGGDNKTADSISDTDGLFPHDFYVSPFDRPEPEYREEEGDLYDGQLAVPGNIRMDRLSVPGDISPPLSAARVSSLFGYRENPSTHQFKFHSGLDLAAPEGDPVRAMLAGTVITAGYDSGYGNYIIIDHGGGLQTLYGHCSKLLCKKGDDVAKSQTIGLVGSTGNSTGPHLHVEFRKDGQRYDPEWILSGLY